jgi:hypothetical protein
MTTATTTRRNHTAPQVGVLPGAGIDDIRDLIAAAGPLTARDIAGGLGVPCRQAEAAIRRMRRLHCLKRDEFDRYRLWSSCANG